MSKENEGITAIVERVASDKVTTKLWLAMPAIEQKLSEGVEHKKMVEALRDGGLDVSLDTFRNLLYRYRRKHGRVKKRKPGNLENPKTPAKVQAEKSKTDLGADKLKQLTKIFTEPEDL